MCVNNLSKHQLKVFWRQPQSRSNSVLSAGQCFCPLDIKARYYVKRAWLSSISSKPANCITTRTSHYILVKRQNWFTFLVTFASQFVCSAAIDSVHHNDSCGLLQNLLPELLFVYGNRASLWELYSGKSDNKQASPWFLVYGVVLMDNSIFIWTRLYRTEHHI